MNGAFFILHFGWDVNDDGQIVGSGLTDGGSYFGYVMTPDDTVPGCPDAPAPCSADFDGSGDVGAPDLLRQLLHWSE